MWELSHWNWVQTTLVRFCSDNDDDDDEVDDDDDDDCPSYAHLNHGKTTAKWCLNNNKLQAPNNCHTNLVHSKKKNNKRNLKCKCINRKICRKVRKKTD